MFKDNRICRLLGIELPVLQGGMIWCSGWRMVSAVSANGGLGVLGAGSMKADELREEIGKVRKATDRPFGVNMPLLYSHVDDCMDVCLSEKVPVLITSAGSPSKWTEKAHAAGCIVGHVVANVKFADKAESADVDFLVCEGVEAGGHNGLDELSTLVVTQMVRAATELPLVSAGGYHDGRGLAAALALGADGIQIGTRFACTVESAAHPAFKEALLRVRDTGTLLTSRHWGPTRQIRNEYSEALLAMELEGKGVEEQRAFVGRGRSKKGLVEGNMVEGELEAGQVAALFERIESVEDIMRELREGYRQAVEELRSQL